MKFSSGGQDRWQRTVLSLAPRYPLLDAAARLRQQRELAASELLRAQEHLSNITAAYLEACRRAGLNPA